MVVHDGDDGDVRSLVEKYPGTILIPGPDRGATAAAAHGVDRAGGDFIVFLHSDDRMCPGALSRVAAAAAARPDVKIWTGGARIFRTLPDGREQTVRVLSGRETTALSLQNICDDIPLLSARFCHRSVFAEIGNFEPRFSESSDREFLLRATIAGVPEAPLDAMVSEMRLHKDSRTIHQRRGRVPPYLAEHVAMAEAILARQDLTGRVRGFITSWRAREVLRLGYHQARNGAWSSAARTGLAAAASDPLWMFRALTILASRRRRNRLYRSEG